MKVIDHHDRTYILRIDRDEEALEQLREFCLAHQIQGGYFSALGAAHTVELAYYRLERKTYETITHEGAMYEIASLQGNVATSDNKTIIHAHGVFALPHMTVAGHVNRLIVGVTCEVVLTALTGQLRRIHSEKIGLKLLSSP